jgi:hypothetical protein
MSSIRHAAAAEDAATVFTLTGNPLVLSNSSKSASMPELAAVSPKRESGPCTSAGPMPR